MGNIDKHRNGTMAYCRIGCVCWWLYFSLIICVEQTHYVFINAVVDGGEGAVGSQPPDVIDNVTHEDEDEDEYEDDDEDDDEYEDDDELTTASPDEGGEDAPPVNTKPGFVDQEIERMGLDIKWNALVMIMERAKYVYSHTAQRTVLSAEEALKKNRKDAKVVIDNQMKSFSEDSLKKELDDAMIAAEVPQAKYLYRITSPRITQAYEYLVTLQGKSPKVLEVVPTTHQDPVETLISYVRNLNSNSPNYDMTEAIVAIKDLVEERVKAAAERADILPELKSFMAELVKLLEIAREWSALTKENKIRNTYFTEQIINRVNEAGKLMEEL
eukprot:GHVQ01027691.1.p1 GENE.GHVQ01027691.1~~GHVQ01027691.1.p1  ORF type:complete len:328 (-),score=63.23 GHVQ01027691.1:213-1196(-)